MKRFFDILVAFTLLFLLLLPLIVLAVTIRLKLGSPIFFSQTRPGLSGSPFTLFKFRTMTDVVDMHGHLLSDEERLTPFGQLLRRTSVDELPELWNVLKRGHEFGRSSTTAYGIFTFIYPRTIS